MASVTNPFCLQWLAGWLAASKVLHYISHSTTTTDSKLANCLHLPNPFFPSSPSSSLFHSGSCSSTTSQHCYSLFLHFLLSLLNLFFSSSQSAPIQQSLSFPPLSLPLPNYHLSPVAGVHSPQCTSFLQQFLLLSLSLSSISLMKSKVNPSFLKCSHKIATTMFSSHSSPETFFITPAALTGTSKFTWNFFSVGRKLLPNSKWRSSSKKRVHKLP